MFWNLHFINKIINKVVFAYLNKFNLIVFFLRLAVYVYSQF